MKLFIKLSCIIAVVAFAANTMADNWATINSTPSGTPATLDSNPVITAIGSQPGSAFGHTYSSWAIFTADTDGSAAGELFGALPAGNTEPTPTVGDTIGATGTNGPFHQIPEIGSLQTLTHTGTAAVPAPTVWTIPQVLAPPPFLTIPANQAGFILELDNVTIYTNSAATLQGGIFPIGNGTFYLRDGVNTNIMEMFNWVTSYMACTAFISNTVPTGPVNIVGFLSESSGFPVEITPFQITAVPEPSSVMLIGCGLMGLFAICRRKK